MCSLIEFILTGSECPECKQKLVYNVNEAGHEHKAASLYVTQDCSMWVTEMREAATAMLAQ